MALMILECGRALKDLRGECGHGQKVVQENKSSQPSFKGHE